MPVKCTGIIFFALTCAFLSLGAAELKSVAQPSLGTIVTTKDALVCSYRDAKVIKAYGIETDAQSAFLSRDASGRMIHAVMGGGTRLSAGKFELKASEKISVTIERTSKGYIVKNASPVYAKITVAVGGKSHRLNLKANAYSRPL